VTFNYSVFIASRARHEHKLRHECFALMAELVLDSVHPSNLGALPPSPRTLIRKADQLGLITLRERIALDDVVVEQRHTLF
jgi:hypothetical protein